MEFPDEPYLYRQDAPHAGEPRPLSQGDVFVGIPLVGPAQRHPKQVGTWTAPKPRTGDSALGLFVTHPCASRSQTTYKLAPFVSLAPVVRCPSGWGPPWDGWYEYFPLPNLRNGENYVAKLGEVCPVPSDALGGQRIAVLNDEGLKALFHRLALNSIRFPETPMHYATEAQRVTTEIDLWEQWVAVTGDEEGFQDWLDEPFGGQLVEDAEGNVIPGSAIPSGETRRSVLLWNREEVQAELSEHLG